MAELPVEQEPGHGVLQRVSTGPEQPRLRMRHRLARLGAVRPRVAVLDPLFKIVRSNHPKADLELIERAYRTAEHHHEGQKRKSGDPYITHPLAVATILAELGMTEPVIVAAAATAWPWLPVEKATTPDSRRASSRQSRALSAPRSLKEPVTCSDSALTST